MKLLAEFADRHGHESRDVPGRRTSSTPKERLHRGTQTWVAIEQGIQPAHDQPLGGQLDFIHGVYQQHLIARACPGRDLDIRQILEPGHVMLRQIQPLCRSHIELARQRSSG